MRKGKTRVLFLALVGVVVLVSLFAIFRKQIFADTITMPSWIDSATVTKYNTWTAGQKLSFDRCASNGVNTKSTLTPQEINQFGSSSVAFNIRPIVNVSSSSPYWPWYQSSYRLIVTPLKYDLQADGSRTLKMRLTLGNPGTSPVIVANPEARYYFWSFSNSVPKVGNVIFTRGVDYTYTLLPGEYVSQDTLELSGVKDPAYWGIEFSNMKYTLSGTTPNFEQPIWDPVAQKTDATLSCIINPLPLAGLVPGSIPSVTPSTEVPGSRAVTFRRGFSTFGNSGMTNGTMFKDAGLFLYAFDGPTNSWKIYPGGPEINTDLKKGYYVYNPSAEKTIRFGFGNPTVTTFELTKGWNMLWTAMDKRLSDLNLFYNGQTLSAQDMINLRTISNNIFIIQDDTATTACTYFKLLSNTDTQATCSGGSAGLGSSSKIPGGKAFWIYVN